MLFNSYVFIFAFLPLVYAGYCFLRRYPERSWTIAWLVLASLVYYAWWMPEFLLLLLTSVAVNAGFGAVLCSGRLSRHASRALLAAGITFNLGLLGYFKYAMFFVENVNHWFGAGLTVPKIILPIGISFITFQKIAFLVDAHRGEVRDFSLRNFLLFVTFFPQLIAGPITHHREIMSQFERRTLPGDRATDLAVGFSIFCVGLFKKVVIADGCALYADAGYGMVKAGQPLDFASAWIAVLGYSLQLYYDFSGYSDMAVGLARLFGIQFPANFHSPYKSTGTIEFWRRWHITLSRFLRDYLYLPLGGNRVTPLRHYLNVCLVMLLGGLWHGANWTFVVWGGVHGILLAVNHGWRQSTIGSRAIFRSVPARGIAVLLTFLVVTLAWVPFRATNLDEAGRMLIALFPASAGAGAVLGSLEKFWAVQFADWQSVSDLALWFKARELWPNPLPPDFLATYRPAGIWFAVVLLATFVLPNSNQLFARFDAVIGLTETQLRHWGTLTRLDWKVAIVISGMFVFSVLQLSRVSPFLYFQF